MMAVQFPDPHEATEQECQFCGRPVSHEFRRTFGDNADVAHRCFDCDTDRRVMRGSAAGCELDITDPADPDAGLANAKTPALTDGGLR